MGAGLLANAVDQSTYVLNDTPHSRASPLPHFVLCQVLGFACAARRSSAARRFGSLIPSAVA
ncbi:hypothetical protein EAH78_11040 [Pseudomonas arsenicoxydans]|uniref:Uncharacterized protein n=1 Tax=Pseudomonas arsenicoxydans TaxID=702115 RepID=A0A502HZI4_9PSED|nr:hypothetical protein EAH78_11040 [Pseudomonas arsenicoxydans]